MEMKDSKSVVDNYKYNYNIALKLDKNGIIMMHKPP